MNYLEKSYSYKILLFSVVIWNAFPHFFSIFYHSIKNTYINSYDRTFEDSTWKNADSNFTFRESPRVWESKRPFQGRFGRSFIWRIFLGISFDTRIFSTHGLIIKERTWHGILRWLYVNHVHVIPIYRKPADRSLFLLVSPDIGLETLAMNRPNGPRRNRHFFFFLPDQSFKQYVLRDTNTKTKLFKILHKYRFLHQKIF